MIRDVTVRPWNVWPDGKAADRREAPFRASFSKTVRLLEKELSMLGAKDVVLELAIVETDIRRDGWVKENARPWSPGAILSFTSKITGPVRYPCDTFFGWQDNVRAIALALEALRSVDRYGVTKRGEQYAGWKALPSSTEPTLTTEIAAEIVSGFTARLPVDVINSRDAAREAVRAARMATHPDRNSGDRSHWDNVDAASAVLSSHHGVSL